MNNVVNRQTHKPSLIGFIIGCTPRNGMRQNHPQMVASCWSIQVAKPCNTLYRIVYFSTFSVICIGLPSLFFTTFKTSNFHQHQCTSKLTHDFQVTRSLRWHHEPPKQRKSHGAHRQRFETAVHRWGRTLNGPADEKDVTSTPLNHSCGGFWGYEVPILAEISHCFGGNLPINYCNSQGWWTQIA